MKYLSKTSGVIRLAALLFGATLLGLASQNATAAGTAAGTPITNTASLSYSVGTVPQTDITGTSTAFVVDEKINLTVAASGVPASVPAGSTAAVAAFSVTNNSNSALDFRLSTTTALAGDNFDPSACTAFVDINGNSVYDAGTDALYIDELAADATQKVLVQCTIPLTATNTQTGLVGLTAEARGDFTGASGVYATSTGSEAGAITQTAGAETPGLVDIVFADVAGPDDGSRDAKHSDHQTYTVNTAVLTVNKTATLLCDPINGTSSPKNIPLSMTRWTIAVSNGAGAADATLTSITDTLSATLAHDANLVLGNSVANCASATGTPESAANNGFKVTTNANRAIGTCANTQNFCYFTTNTADGLDISGQDITATFSTILPTDAGTGHGSSGLLKAGETVTIIFNTTTQ